MDLIGYEGDVLALIEVKSRTSALYGDAVEAVDPRKQRRIARAAREYVARRRHPGPVRFDVVTVAFSGDAPPRVDLLRGAFEASDEA